MMETFTQNQIFLIIGLFILYNFLVCGGMWCFQKPQVENYTDGETLLANKLINFFLIKQAQAGKSKVYIVALIEILKSDGDEFWKYAPDFINRKNPVVLAMKDYLLQNLEKDITETLNYLKRQGIIKYIPEEDMNRNGM
jgi:hypothetical protein